MESNDNGESNGTQLLLPEGRSLKRKVTERSLKTPEGVSVYCLMVGLIFFKQSRRESLVLTYALDEVRLASADGFVNGTEALFELGAR